MKLTGAKDAAKALGISRETLIRKAKSGEIPFVMKMDGGTGAYLFDEAVIQRLAEERAA